MAAASLYATILGYSRVPFAAARDGDFFRVFARVHPTKHFPHVSLLVIALVSIPFCFFTLGQLVSWLIQVQILLRFIWQCAAVVLLRKYRPDIPQPFTMWLYPLPAVLSLARCGSTSSSRARGRHRVLVGVPARTASGAFASIGEESVSPALLRRLPRAPADSPSSDTRPGTP